LRYGFPNSDQPAQDAVFDALKDLIDAWDDLADARSRIAELEKDAERLDWVEVYVRQHAFGVTLIQRNDKGTLREAIDKAIAAQRQKEGE
jgi:hypothetical protein